jgi:condensation domain-containing protein
VEHNVSLAKNASLCWGQRYIWLRYHHLPPRARHEAHIVMRLKLPDGVTLARIRSTLGYLVRRHEILRTTYPLDAGPVQHVNPPAALPIVVATAERDGTAAPAEVMDELSTTEFDLSTEWPIRACVITAAAVPKQLVLVVNHVAVDDWAIDALKREIAALGAGAGSGRPAALAPVRHQPLDLARYESSADATAMKERAAKYWQDEVSRLPVDAFAGVRRPAGKPTARCATLTSPAMLDARRRIAARHQVWPSLVHATAYNMMMAAYTGSGSISHLSFAGNRDSGPYTDTMTCMFSPLLMRVDCHDDPPFSQLLQRTAQRFEQARSHSPFPYDELVELMSRESFRRGQAVRTGSEFNFINHSHRACRSTRTKLIWNPTPSAWAEYGSDTYFLIYEWKDAVVVTLNAAATIMDAGAVEQFLRGYETVLLAHDAPSTDLRISDVVRMLGISVPAPPIGRRIVRTGDDLVDLGRVEAMLAEHPAIRHARAYLETLDSEQGGLVVDVVASRPVTPAELRGHVLGRMYDHHPVRCPDQFRIYDGTVLGLDRIRRPESWRELTPMAKGNGHGIEPCPATSAAERTLAAVVQQVNGLDHVNLSRSYTVAGGRVLRIPQVLAELRHHGWEGVSVYQIASAQPLRALAARLAPVAVTAAAA